MKRNDLTVLKNWFADYCASFFTPVKEDQRNIEIKQRHTYEVCLNALRIGRDLKLNDREMLTAEAIALLHDVGRFRQYRQYKTFDDAVSVNHAALGAKVLIEKKVLQELPEEDQEIIIRCVTLHNVFSLPAGLDDTTLLFAKLVRDADKLDILRVVIEYYEQDEGSRADAVALGLPDVPEYSPAVLDRLKKGEMAQKADLRTLTDFKLLQLAWLYDLNFASSLRTVLERRYIGKLAVKLPAADEIKDAVDVVRAYVDGRLREG